MSEFQINGRPEWPVRQTPMRGPAMPGQGGSSGSAPGSFATDPARGGSTGRATPGPVTPSMMGGNNGATLRDDQRPLDFWKEPGAYMSEVGRRALYANPQFPDPMMHRPRVPGEVTPPNRAPQPARPMPVTPARMSAMDMLSMMTGMPHGVTRFQPPTPTTPQALSPMDFVQHGTGPAYPMEHAMGLPLPGRTP